MKKFTILIVAAIVSIATAVPASAQLKFGLKVGTAVNSLKFQSDNWEETFSTDNRAGFTGGAMLEFTAPMLGVGFDASVMYMHRSNTLPKEVTDITENKVNTSRDYIDIPLNVKWKISIPVVSKFLKPYIATGPSFAFRVSKNDFKEFVNQQKCDISWNFGFGVELLSHVQVGASYGMGLNNTLDNLKIRESDKTSGIEGKNRYWTITAAYLF